jgi:hypothetical protein
MTTVSIKPLPHGFRSVPRRLWCGHPPMFDGEPTRDDIALAIELLEALDPDSFDWYGGAETIARLRERLGNSNGLT